MSVYENQEIMPNQPLFPHVSTVVQAVEVVSMEMQQKKPSNWPIPTGMKLNPYSVMPVTLAEDGKKTEIAKGFR